MRDHIQKLQDVIERIMTQHWDDRARLKEQCKGLAEAAMNNGQGLLLLERERDRLRKALAEAREWADTAPQEADNA